MKNDLGPQVPESTRSDHLIRLLDIMNENLTQSFLLHREFLRLQEQNLEVIASALKRQHTPVPQKRQTRAPVISRSQLVEFGIGSIARCFGPEYISLDQRKSPRIPNGDLLMMDRVVAISARRGELNPPASIVTELDIAPEAWFIRENDYPGLPLGVLLEIALQPCGILSAYMGTSLLLPADVNLFRNLDGEIRIHAPLFLAGKTVMAEAELLSSVTAGGMTIQSYSFRVSCEGDLVAEGQSSFGYFTEVVMAKQSGLVLPEESLSDAPSATTSEGNRSSLFDAAADHSRLSRQTHLDLVDRVELVERGGRFGRGLILGEKRLAGQEWFFENHFYQDPVMPGSLGLEAVIQGMWSLLMRTDTYRQTRIPVISFSNDAAFTWKYRGQVTPASRQLVYEVHIRQLNDAQDQVNLLCDAEFWVDGVRIYAFRDLRVGLEKGLHI